MDELLISIGAKKRRLDELRPLSRQALARLEHYYDIELTYTSNAIEGNTLSAVETAFTAHRRLGAIHPFNDGNGRTARLLMNLVLIRAGYPPIAVRPEDRLEFIRSLQQEQGGQGADSFNALLYRRLEATLDDYVSALQEAQPPARRRSFIHNRAK